MSLSHRTRQAHYHHEPAAESTPARSHGNGAFVFVRYPHGACSILNRFVARLTKVCRAFALAHIIHDGS